MSVVRALWERFRYLVAELAKFGIVGATCAVVDIGLTNLLRFGLDWGPLTSKTLAVAISATLAFVGNRFWTFRHRANQGLAKEYFLYFVLNAVGLLIALLVVGFTVYTLKWDGPLAYNLSANVVGLGLGTLFRFWAYKRWVFLPSDVPPVDPHTGLPARSDATSAYADSRHQQGGGTPTGAASTDGRPRLAGAEGAICVHDGHGAGTEHDLVGDDGSSRNGHPPAGGDSTAVNGAPCEHEQAPDAEQRARADRTTAASQPFDTEHPATTNGRRGSNVYQQR